MPGNILEGGEICLLPEIMNVSYTHRAADKISQSIPETGETFSHFKSIIY
jgi:hypothetical protein